MSEMLQFKSYIKSDTDFTEQNWQVGDEKDLPTLGGMGVFKLVERTPEHLIWRSGDLETMFTKKGNGWNWSHCFLNWKAVAHISFV